MSYYGLDVDNKRLCKAYWFIHQHFLFMLTPWGSLLLFISIVSLNDFMKEISVIFIKLLLDIALSVNVCMLFFVHGSKLFCFSLVIWTNCHCFGLYYRWQTLPVPCQQTKMGLKLSELPQITWKPCVHR